jgi:hypothetical protein
MVVREYLVENFGFNDSRIKTQGLGKQMKSNSKSDSNTDWGSVQILIFPAGTKIPAAKQAPAGKSSITTSDQTDQVNDAAHKP